ncbi:hypothetical protein FA95DRAFT_1561725 [Auriscalpium vulgare]|uniref:Uncharacterized protein n=1 Tax=Auriscalpium vulgare TaxID=40419 RepID=A0ACB8RM78_9AGAM|nr:hypothetical protein FA95DRAFT_1561725 [Auriscalpium vulgare]
MHARQLPTEHRLHTHIPIIIHALLAPTPARRHLPARVPDPAPHLAHARPELRTLLARARAHLDLAPLPSAEEA